MALYMQATYADGREVTVRVSAKAQVMFERHWKITIFEYGRKRSMEQLLWLAWQALTEAGSETRDFEGFLDVIADVEHKTDTPDDPVDDKAVNPEPDPSRMAQPRETS